MLLQLFNAGLHARDIYPELKIFFYKGHANVTWEQFLKTKLGLWMDMRLGTENILHGSVRAVEQSGILLQKAVMVILRTMCLVLKMQ